MLLLVAWKFPYCYCRQRSRGQGWRQGWRPGWGQGWRQGLRQGWGHGETLRKHKGLQPNVLNEAADEFRHTALLSDVDGHEQKPSYVRQMIADSKCHEQFKGI